jgi:hypothetical protein
MKQELKSQYEAHVAFEIAQLTGAKGEEFIAAHVHLLWNTLRNTPVPKLVNQEQVMGIAQRYVTEGPVTDELLELISTVAIKTIQSSANREATLGDLVNDDTRLALVEHVLTLKKLRNDLIHASVGNPLYAEIVSDLLYNGIADYLEAGTEMTKKVPGMGSLMKKGGTMLSKRVGSIEDRLRGYIGSNMQGILNSSEAMLKDSLTDERIREVNSEIWKAARKLHPQVDGYISESDVEKFVSLGAEFWLHLRQTDYFNTLLEEGVATVLDDAKNQTVSDWIAGIGIGEDTVVEEITKQWALLAPIAKESGYLEAAIRARLEPFYAQL